jgi:hypothetical protein
MKKMDAFEYADMKEFEPEAKIGIIATINPQGQPHITLISSLRAKTRTQLIWGQFTEGLSKAHVRIHPNTGFLILTTDKQLWRGKATWTHEEKHGEDYEMYNNQPMFRYNAYFGINTVHYMGLVETYGRENLPLGLIVISSLLTKIAKSSANTVTHGSILKPWAESLFNRLNALKFIAYIDTEGFPRIIPLLQCQASSSRRIAFSPLAYQEELSSINNGTTVAVFGLTMDMEDILVRGSFIGFDRYRAIQLGVIDIEWVYNSMPPKQGQIYPLKGVRPVVNF